MDSIKDLIGAADPLRLGPANIPDPEEELLRVTRAPELFTDEPRQNITPLAERRAKRARTAGVLAIVAAAAAAGVLVGGNLGSLTASPAPAGTASPQPPGTPSAGPTPAESPSPSLPASDSPSAGPTPGPSASAAPSSATPAGPTSPIAINAPGPSLFTSEEAGASFMLPSGWTAVEVPPVSSFYPRTTGLEVYNEAGDHMATFEHWFGGGLGGACGPGEYIVTELDSEPVDLNTAWAADAGVRFSYRVLDQTSVGNGFTYQIGLADKTSGQLVNSCVMYSVVSADDGSMLSFAKSPGGPVFHSVAEARAYAETEEYRNLKDMILSLRLL